MRKVLAAFLLSTSPLLVHAADAGPKSLPGPVLWVLDQCVAPDNVDDGVFAITCGEKKGLLLVASAKGARTVKEWVPKPVGLINTMARRNKATVIVKHTESK